MSKQTTLLLFVGLTIGLYACGGSKGSSAGEVSAGPTAPDASTFSAHGLTIKRPDGWTFIEPDASMAPDTVIVMQGPAGDQALAPAIEISRRALDARQRRRKPAHILTQMTTEIVQVFDGFEMHGSPDDIDIAGQSGAVVKLTYTESLPDGAEVKRGARFYGIVHGDSIWVVRCIGAPDGSNDPEFEAIVKTVTIQS